RMVRNLRSPHVIDTIDAGFADGSPYYAMAFVDGESVEAACRRGRRFDPGHTRQIVGDVATAITAASSLGPGRLAPSYVMVRTDGRAQVWNLGIVEWRWWAHERVAGTYTAPGYYRWVPELTPDDAIGRVARTENDAAMLALMAFRMLTGAYY